MNFDDLETTMKKTLLHVEQLRETLKAIHENNILKMYVDENVLSFMNTKEFEQSLTKNETIEASVAFIDICGFTTITENEKPDTVVKLLNKYFDVMVKEILAQNGHVDKFIGDADWRYSLESSTLTVPLKPASLFVPEIEKMPNEALNISFLPKIAAGIHCGEMVRGNIGAASLRRLDYTVIGDVVNTAQRLQGVSQAGQVVINETAYELVKASFTCEKIGEVSLKHKALPQVIYNVVQ